MADRGKELVMEALEEMEDLETQQLAHFQAEEAMQAGAEELDVREGTVEMEM